MPETEGYRKGSEMRRKLLGDAYADRTNNTTYKDPVMRKFIDVFIVLRRFARLWAAGCMPILFDRGSLLDVTPHRFFSRSRFTLFCHKAPKLSRTNHISG